MSNDDSAENPTVFVPDFFFECIARIIPGLVVVAICIYWSKGNFETVYSHSWVSVFVLVGAWIIGVILDIGFYAIAKSFAGVFKSVVKFILPGKWVTKLHEWVRKVAPVIDLGFIRQLGSWDRSRAIKSSAQVIFYRSMGEICFLTLVACGVMYLAPRWDFWLPGLHDQGGRYALVSVILFLVFVLCWTTQRVAFGELVEEMKKENELRKKNAVVRQEDSKS